MVQIKEFRITMPFSLDEYRVGQTYMKSRMQRENTKGREGVEVVASEPFTDGELGTGHYSHVVYHFQRRAPAWIRALAPLEALSLVEKNWNAFPRFRTEISCPYFTNFKITTDTFCVADRGETENVMNLCEADVAVRKVDHVDIASSDRDMWSRIIARKPTDPSKIELLKLNRGPLAPGWQDTCKPAMTVYKVVRVDAPYWGIGRQMELATGAALRALYLEAHRKCYRWADDWCNLTVADARRIEQENIDIMRRSLSLSDRLDSEHFDEDAFNEAVVEAAEEDEEVTCTLHALPAAAPAVAA